MEYLISKLLLDFEKGVMTRRQLIQSLSLAATAASALGATPGAAADGKVAQAASLNHLGYQVADYAKSRDWYADLFGMKVVVDDGQKAMLALGETLLVFHTRKSPATPVINHICFTLANWDDDKSVREKVQAEIKRRGQDPKPSEHSLHINDPDGFTLQLGGKVQYS
ncbi:MAG TPA: VOC family protein [Candidatus Dormibacteraeota bacterium]|jgi:catechol 2,3-dioxygenase-like lactoylglutathione lyase family enzyme|nr:VOC family protein [Candidatus Dormibacteraeota bacterium]